jgi:squalene/oxidosqualene cyclase-like protein
LPEGSLADRPGAVLSPHDRARDHLIAMQGKDGAWEGEVVWCTMILSQYVIVRHVTKRSIDDRARADILRHYTIARTADGGWGLHPEGPAQIFTTALAYVALRLLGLGPEDALTAPARAWLHKQPGGVLAIPTWGKFWLALLDLYGADGVAALPPELFVLPSWTPFHPRRWYCHTRYIYLGMSYLYGCGFTADLGPLRDPLRGELYSEPYEAINFSAHREHVSPVDLYAKPARAVTIVRRMLTRLPTRSPRRFRDHALRVCVDKILHEQRVSRYQGLSPVNGLLNCLAIHATDGTHPDLEPSMAGLDAWRWCDAAEGTRYAGARSQVWDTAFAARALLASAASDPRAASPLAPTEASAEGLRRAHAYLAQAQMIDELPNLDRGDRDPIRGGWCFSDGRHRWPVSDCTAEALTAMLEMEKVPGLIPEAQRLPQQRLDDAVHFLLARQNADGGFSTYERARGGAWLDRLNPSEMFRDCMIERSYVECTASVVEALATVRATHPGFSPKVAQAVPAAIAFLRRSQMTDGTFPAAWGICFTYSIFHVTKALRAAGIDAQDPALVAAANWLRKTQRTDGGWGEHFSTCLTGVYVPHPRAQAVMTSWALLALAEIDPSSGSIHAGTALLQAMQTPEGSWPQEAVNGVFFGTAMLDYRLYCSYFPAWALARCAHL